MNYKKILKSQRLRFGILKLLRWIPDEVMIPLQYRIKLGRWADLKNPQRYTEKLQIYKMKYRNPVMGICVDKYRVRKYIEEKGLGAILIPLYGVYDSPQEVDFDSFPNTFVLKTTDGGGGNNVMVCSDKHALNIESVKDTLVSWMNVKDVNAGREWAYTQITSSKIIVEKKLEPSNPKYGIVDYKFFCFDGVFKYLYVVTERIPGKNAIVSIYDRSFNKLDVSRVDESTCDYVVPKPKNYDRMIEIAECLAKGFPHVRVDLYNENGAIYFGELTFYDGSGYFQFVPDSFDYEMGRYFDVSKLTGGGLCKSKG